MNAGHCGDTLAPLVNNGSDITSIMRGFRVYGAQSILTVNSIVADPARFELTTGLRRAALYSIETRVGA
jgi:hypothetical protein